jgi:hypothetical protein
MLVMKASLRRVKVMDLLLPRLNYLERKILDTEFRQIIPDVDEVTSSPLTHFISFQYTKEPPALPPHLRHIILNKVSYFYSSLIYFNLACIVIGCIGPPLAPTCLLESFILHCYQRWDDGPWCHRKIQAQVHHSSILLHNARGYQLTI